MIDLLKEESTSPTVLCLGNFDGVHLGHQALFKKALEVKEKDEVSGVLLFHEHTLNLLENKKRHLLTPFTEKVELIQSLGIERIFHLPFTSQIRQMTGEDFIRLLKEKTQISKLVVGEDYRFGHYAKYNVHDLIRLENKYDFKTIVVPEVVIEGHSVRSSAIRRALTAGRIDQANRLLARPYQVRGPVVSGKGRGRHLGFPTANIDTGEYFLPKEGVYLTRSIWQGQAYPSISSVGINRTFDEEELKIEAYFFDFQGNLYGQEVALEFIDYMRDNVRFDSQEELIEQLKKDKNQASLYYQQVNS